MCTLHIILKPSDKDTTLSFILCSSLKCWIACRPPIQEANPMPSHYISTAPATFAPDITDLPEI